MIVYQINAKILASLPLFNSDCTLKIMFCIKQLLVDHRHADDKSGLGLIEFGRCQVVIQFSHLSFAGPDSSNGKNRRLGVRVPLGRRFFLGRKPRHLYKKIRSWIANECCCLCIVDIPNVNLQPKISLAVNIRLKRVWIFSSRDIFIEIFPNGLFFRPCQFGICIVHHVHLFHCIMCIDKKIASAIIITPVDILLPCPVCLH